MIRSASRSELETHLRALLRTEPVYARVKMIQIVPADCIMRSWLAKIEVAQVTEADKRLLEEAVAHVRRSFPCID